MLLFNSTLEWISSSPTIISREYQVMILVRSVEKRRGVCRQRQLVLLDIWAVDTRQPELGITLHLARADISSADQSLESALDNRYQRRSSFVSACARPSAILLQFHVPIKSNLNPVQFAVAKAFRLHYKSLLHDKQDWAYNLTAKWNFFQRYRVVFLTGPPEKWLLTLRTFLMEFIM